MTKNEIKKKLYLQKPVAKLLYIRKGLAYYDAVVRINDESVLEYKTVFFEIPVSDMGDADFLPEMESSLLLRWIIGED